MAINRNFQVKNGITVGTGGTILVSSGSNIGINNTNPVSTLDVVGTISASSSISGSTLTSTVSTGTAPLTVASTTQVSNLNSSFLQGYQTSSSNTSNSIVLRDASGNFSAGTITSTNSSITGILTVSAGSTVIPSITFSTGNSTGIFSPGSNQLAFTTNGTEDLRITSAGNIGIGTTNPSVILDIFNTGGIRVPVGSSGQRPTGTGITGIIRYNNSTNQFEGYGTAWGSIGGGAVGGGADRVFYENDQIVTTDYAITSGRNALSAGTVTVNSGVTVTIPSGSVWSIV